MIKILLLCGICCWSAVLPAQNVGVGTLSPDSSALLDIQSTAKGLLIPTMTQTQMQAIHTPATGLLIFQTDHTSGFYYNAGTPATPSWQPLAPPSNQTVWKLTGNSGTNPANDFVGTADNSPLSFRVNNITSGFLDSIKARTFLGYEAGNTASTGYGNVAIGKSAMSPVSTGNANVALGDSALNSYVEGDGSVAVGFYSLAQNAYGTYNTAIGYYSLYATPLSGNTATGTLALHANTQGGNTAKGYGAIGANIAGSNNTALGTSALGNNPSTDYQGYQNTAAGGAALNGNTSGRSNTASGYNTLVTNSSGGANTATGYEALGSNLTGSANTSIGANTIGTTRDGTALTAIGAYAQQNASTGPEGENTTVGSYALYNNASGVFCTAIGGYALYNNSGKSNTATGYAAMYGTGVNGSDNTAFGANTLTLMTANSDGNTAFGTNALLHSSAGAYNTAAGYAALYLLADSRYNTAIGYGAGIGYALTYVLSHSNTLLGANCDVSTDNLNNCIAIGQQVTCTASNQVRIGNLATNSIGGQVGWTTFSDGRFKKNIRENVKGLDFILRLKPVTYQLDIDLINSKLHAKNAARLDPRMQTAMAGSGLVVHTGFVAQDVEKAALESGFDFSGVDKPTTADGLYGLRYEDFVVPLIKAVQEQQRQIETLQKGNAEMNKSIQRIEEKMKH
jgi:hypothetical protein